MIKTLTFNGEQYEAERIVKTDTDIIGYNKGSDIPVFSFKGIADFTQYQLTTGETFDIDPEQEKEQRIADLELAIASILGGA